MKTLTFACLISLQFAAAQVNQPDADAFANSEMHEHTQTALNSASPSAEYQALQGKGNFATDALSGAVAIPAGASVFGSNAVAGYINTASTITNAVGVLGQSRCTVKGTKCWGANTIAFDVSGLTSGVGLLGIEVDMQPQNAPSAYTTANGVLSSIFTPQSGTFTNANAFAADHGQTGVWNTAFFSRDNAAEIGVSLGPVCRVSGMNSCSSQPIALSSSKSGVRVANNNVLSLDRFGNIQIQTGRGSGLRIVNHQNDLELFAIQDSGGVRIGEASAPLAVAGSDLLFGSSATHRLSMTNDDGLADVVVGATTTDTLTNKTLTSPILTTPRIGDGSTINRMLLGSGTLTYGGIPPGNCQERALAITGADVGAVASASPRTNLGNVNLSWSARVSTRNTVQIRVCNPTGGIVTPTAVLWSTFVVE